MTYSVRLSSNARRDRDRILAWYDDPEPLQGGRFLDAFYKAARQLEQQPRLGYVISGDVRSWRMSRNLVCHREDFVLQTTSSSSPSSASTRGFGCRRCVHSPALSVQDRCGDKPAVSVLVLGREYTYSHLELCCCPPCQSRPAPSSSGPNLFAEPLHMTAMPSFVADYPCLWVGR